MTKGRCNISNIINYRKDNDIHFTVLNVWITLPYSNQTVEKKKMALIGIKDTRYNLVILHQLSEFIIENWKFLKYNTQKKHSSNVISFLNFLREKDVITSLEDIEVKHCTIFLNTLIMRGNKSSTVKDIQRTLILFLIWLSDKQYIYSDSIKRIKRKYENSEISNSNLLDVIYSNDHASLMEHAFPIEYVPLFIEIALKYANPIALGIYFQFFGGLRESEVLNLNKSQIARRINRGDFSLNLKTQHYRTDLEEYPSVKKPRLQEVLNINNWGFELFQSHINTYSATDGSLALFINRDGKAMSERSYRRYFNIVKSEFISLLESSSDSDMKLLAISLKHSKWSTHIGRGTYTHMIAEHSKNPIEIAHNRGDSNLDSAITYFANTSRIYESLRESFQHMHSDYIVNLIRRDEDNE